METVIALLIAVPLVIAFAVFMFYYIAREDQKCRHCGTVCVRAQELDHTEEIKDDGLWGHKDAPGKPIPYAVKVYRCPNCGKVYDECDLIRGRGISG